ncbi:MAG: dipicolinate synthase subunit DpsA [Nitrospinota bacterium]|jgi:dipicolinate synthase subunit A|nr:dipicolinate synthase subunit DpsA [Nitrospinota bacterium]
MSAVFEGRKAAFLGGDRRQIWIVEEAVKAGFEVSAVGCPPEIEKFTGKPQENSIDDAVREADAIFLPIPVHSSRRDGSLYSDNEPFPLFLTDECLNLAKKGAVVLVGHAPAELTDSIRRLGFHLEEFEEDDERAILNGIPTAEGVVAITIQNTEECFPTMKCMVIGFGRISVTLARDLRRLGAEVWVAARRLEVRARALQMGFHPLSMEEYMDAIGEMDVIYQTATAVLMDKEALSRVRPDTLVVEMASPPGGSDFEAAKELGARLIWARAQAGTAPKAAAGWQWNLNARLLKEHWGL